MNVRCPSCQSLYRVDPARVPEAGVRTRCSSCQAVFSIDRQGVASESVSSAAAVTGAPVSTPSAPASAPLASPVAPPASPFGIAATATAPAIETGPTVESTVPVEPVRRAAAPTPAPPSPTPPAPAPAQTTAATPAPSAPPAPMPAGAATGSRPKPVFGVQDPDTRAQRIARALVSDMVVYNGDRRDQSLAAGTLKGDFREEILKSWEEYVEQVGAEMAKKTPHFRDALNSILAKGQSVF